jgi:hypothetical protein
MGERRKIKSGGQAPLPDLFAFYKPGAFYNLMNEREKRI